MASTQFVTTLLSAKGEVRKANIPLTEGCLTIDALQKYLRKKEAPEAISTIMDTVASLSLTLFGYRKGKADTENKTEFPLSLGGILLFGDVIVVAHKEGTTWATPVPYLPTEWEKYRVEEDKEEDKEEEEAEAEAEEAEEAEEEEAEEAEEEAEAEEEVEDEEETEEADAEEEGEGEAEGGEDEMEPEPIITKRKKVMPLHLKIDTNAFKDELNVDESVSINPLRQLYYTKLQFLKPEFDEIAILSLERSIVLQAMELAKKNYIPRSWKALPFRHLYKAVGRTILWNIHPSSPIKNRRLLARCKEGEFPLEAIPSMTPYDMFPEHWKELSDKLLVREQKILEGNKSRATDEYKCRRCGKRECTFYEMQTRSADEPTTIFITCLNCGQKWRH